MDAIENIVMKERENWFHWNARELLERPGICRKRVQYCLDELNDLRTGYPQGHGFREKVQQSRNVNDMDDLMIRIEYAQERLHKARWEYWDAFNLFRYYVDRRVYTWKESNMQSVLIRRYSSGKSYQEIGKDMDYSVKYLRRTHSEAVKWLQEILDKEKAVGLPDQETLYSY